MSSLKHVKLAPFHAPVAHKKPEAQTGCTRRGPAARGLLPTPVPSATHRDAWLPRPVDRVLVDVGGISVHVFPLPSRGASRKAAP